MLNFLWLGAENFIKTHGKILSSHKNRSNNASSERKNVKHILTMPVFFS